MSASDYPTNYGGNGSGSSDDENSSVALNVLLTFVIGAFSIGALVVLVWALATVFDRYCCCLPGFQALNADIFSQIDRGPIARKAGLWGVLPDERRAILKKILNVRAITPDMIKGDRSSELKKQLTDTTQGMPNEDDQPKEESEIVEQNLMNEEESETTLTGKQDSSETKEINNKDQDITEEDVKEGERSLSNHMIPEDEYNTDDEANANDVEPTNTPVAESQSLSAEESDEEKLNEGGQNNDSVVKNGTTETSCPQKTAAEESEPSDSEDNSTVDKNISTIAEDSAVVTPEDDIRDHDVACAICLNEYKEGEMILNGTTCDHFFHEDCAMKWLEKHDHCPFCRKEMVTGKEFRETAEEMLDKQRMKELTKWGRQADAAEANGDNDGSENDDEDTGNEREEAAESSENRPGDEETGNPGATLEPDETADKESSNACVADNNDTDASLAPGETADEETGNASAVDKNDTDSSLAVKSG